MDQIDIFVGAKIRFRRRELGLAQGGVASALGITFQQLQKYERGVNRVSAGRLYGLCSVLDVEPAYFFEEVAGVPIADGSESVLLDDVDCFSLNRAFHRITDLVLRRAIVALVEKIADDRTEGIESSGEEPVRARDRPRSLRPLVLQNADR